MNDAPHPIAWAVFADNGNMRLWSTDRAEVLAFAEKVGAPLIALHPGPPIQTAHMDDAVGNACRLLRDAAQELADGISVNGVPDWKNEPETHGAYVEHITAAHRLEQWADSIGAGGVEPLRRRECLHQIAEPAQAAPVSVTLMTEDQASKWAWDRVRQDVGTDGWTTGDSCNFFGFFLHGWNYRGQYELQRRAALAAAPQPPAQAQEPVAWRHNRTLCLYETKADVPLGDGDEWAEPLYTHPAPQQAVPAYQRALDIRTAQGWKLGGDKVPVLYTDTINGEQVCRDDVWLCTTAAFAQQAVPASEQAGAPETLPCERCSGNGEIVTDWDRYKHPRPGDVGDEAVADCPDCDGTGRVDSPASGGAAPVAEGDALPREDFAWLVVQEACETEPADEDDPECIRILCRDLKSAVLGAFLRHDAARAQAKKGGAK